MSESIDQATVLKAVSDFQDPESGRSVVTMNQVQDIRIENNELFVTLALTTYSAPLWEDTRDEFQAKLVAAFPQLAVVHVGEAIEERPAEKWAK